MSIPELFDRDADGRVIDGIPERSRWVRDALATRLWVGHAMLVAGRLMWKRHPEGIEPPEYRVDYDQDPVRGGRSTWVPLDPLDDADAPFFEALAHAARTISPAGWLAENEGRTFELVGPGIAGNPDEVEVPTFMRHAGMVMVFDQPLSLDYLQARLLDHNWQGIVWWSGYERAKFSRVNALVG